MTALTREAIVEAAARAQYMDDRANRGGDGPFTWPEWDDLPVFEQAICRQFVFPVVLATLDALMPLVVDMRDDAVASEREAETAAFNLRHDIERQSLARAAVHYADARKLRSVIAP